MCGSTYALSLDLSHLVKLRLFLPQLAALASRKTPRSLVALHELLIPTLIYSVLFLGFFLKKLSIIYIYKSVVLALVFDDFFFFFFGKFCQTNDYIFSFHKLKFMR